MAPQWSSLLTPPVLARQPCSIPTCNCLGYVCASLACFPVLCVVFQFIQFIAGLLVMNTYLPSLLFSVHVWFTGNERYFHSVPHNVFSLFLCHTLVLLTHSFIPRQIQEVAISVAAIIRNHSIAPPLLPRMLPTLTIKTPQSPLLDPSPPSHHTLLALPL
jgi:hypothetical protein